MNSKPSSGRLVAAGVAALGLSLIVAAPASAQTIYTQLSAGSSHSCAVTNNGRIHCWGANTVFGVLGNGSRGWR